MDLTITSLTAILKERYSPKAFEPKPQAEGTYRDVVTYLEAKRFVKLRRKSPEALALLADRMDISTPMRALAYPNFFDLLDGKVLPIDEWRVNRWQRGKHGASR